MTVKNTRNVTMSTPESSTSTPSWTVRSGLTKQKNTDHYPIYGTLKQQQDYPIYGTLRKQQDKQCRPKKYWKPDVERMKEYNRRIFEILWSKEEQRRKDMENSKDEGAENLATPSTPDCTGNKQRSVSSNGGNEEADNWGPFAHVDPRTPETASMQGSSKDLDTTSRAHHHQLVSGRKAS